MVWSIGDKRERKALDLIERHLSESDHAVGILVGTLVERSLERLIKSSIHDDGKIWEKRSHPSGPFGSFAVKVDLARLLGLITHEAWTDMTTLKDIRNHFAHNLEIEGFSTQCIESRCMNLKIFEKYVLNNEDQIKRLHGGDKKGRFAIGNDNVYEEIKTPKGRYVWSARVFTVAFNQFHEHVTPRI